MKVKHGIANNFLLVKFAKNNFPILTPREDDSFYSIFTRVCSVQSNVEKEKMKMAWTRLFLLLFEVEVAVSFYSLRSCKIIRGHSSKIPVVLLMSAAGTKINAVRFFDVFTDTSEMSVML